MSSSQTIQDLIHPGGDRDPHATALAAPSRAMLSYEGLQQQTAATIAALRHADIGSQDTVAVVLPNGPEMAAAVVGVVSGAVCAPLNPGYSAEEFRFYLTDLRAAALLLPAGGGGAARAVANELGVRCLDVRWESDWPAGRFVLGGGGVEGVRQDGPPRAEDVALVLHTSGTTSRPKLVPLTHGNLVASARNISTTLLLTPRDRCLNVMPLFHIHGVAGALLSSLASGASIVCTPGFQAPVFLEWLEEFHPTWYTAVPAMHQAILARAEGRRDPVGCRLRFIRSSSSALPPSLMVALEATFHAPVIEAYGMTEAAHQMASNLLPPLARKPGSVGLAVGTEIAVMGASGCLLPTGAVGEIVIRGANVTRGYVASFATETTGFTDGWFRTGDEGRFDSDGYLYISGRLKEIINRGGEKISPREVDEVLLAHPQVAEAVTFAVPDLRLGEEVGAVVVLKPGAVVTNTELREFSAARLADFKVPRIVMFRDGIPKGPTGKLQRIGLAKALGISAIPAMPDEARPEFVAPRTSTEEVFAKIWQNVLHLRRVGVHDRFLDLGGDSILAAQIVSRLSDVLDRQLSLVQFFDHPTIAQCADAVDQASSSGARTRTLPRTKTSARSGDPPLSSAQHRLWFLDRLNPGSASYNRPVLLRLTGTLNSAAVAQALAEIVRRHEALRTVFCAKDGVPRQVILPPAPVAMIHCKSGELRGEARRPFDLEKGPLLRASLAQVDAHEHLLLLATHHIVFDDWSERILLHEFGALYGQFAGGAGADLPDLPLQVADLAILERERLASASPDPELLYWRTRLAGAAVAEVKPDFPRPRVQTFAGTRLTRALAPDLSAALLMFSRREGVTLFTTMLAVFQVLLGRHTGQPEITVGSPVQVRAGNDAENLIGVFVNTLVLRTSLEGDPTVSELLLRARATILEAVANQCLPFERLVDALAPDRDLSRTPLFQALFQLRDATGRTVELHDLRAVSEPMELGVAKFDFSVEVVESPQGLSCACDYNTDLFAPETIARLLGHYETLLRAVAADPSRRVSELEILSPDERLTVLSAWNRTPVLAAPERRLHHCFEAQVLSTPEAVAATYENASISYAELNRRADDLAHHLRECGVGPDCPVGVSIERSIEMITAVLAVLKAGGACVPLDPDYPRQRLDFMIAEARVQMVLTKGPPPSQRIHPAVSSGDPLAYVIFTSGSTGMPKAVAMGHGPLCNLIAWQLRNPGFSPKRKTLQFASLSFDVAFQEMFATWGSGGTLVLIPDTLRRDLPQLWRFIEDESIERLLLPFVALRGFAEVAEAEDRYPAALREIITAGEQLQITEQVRHFFARLPSCWLENQYGPAETHVVTSFRLEGPVAVWPTLPPIGRPIANARILILDAHRRLVPIGVPGELHIGGPVLARGYLGQPALTAERFFTDPFTAAPGARLYRTGDLARSLPGGEIEFLGRADQQVKIRGYRVELGEIETQLSRHPAVRAVAVIMRDARLVAYLTLHAVPRPSHHDWVSFLEEFLPEPMIPARFIVLDELPLLPSGKADRRALPDPVLPPRAGSRISSDPDTALEHAIAAIWREVLHADPVGVDDNFFDLGGHSLAVAQVHSRLRSQLKRDVPIVDLFRHSTVRALARHLDVHGDTSEGRLAVDDRARRQRDAYERQRRGRG